jgi:hypothetical protein
LFLRKGADGVCVGYWWIRVRRYGKRVEKSREEMQWVRCKTGAGVRWSGRLRDGETVMCRTERGNGVPERKGGRLSLGVIHEEAFDGVLGGLEGWDGTWRS